MSICRKFIDWSQPALPAAVDYLCERYRRGDMLDLDRVVLVFPGARAGRRLLELLVQRAADQRLVLLPPQRCTVGHLPELLYESKRPFATDLVQRLAWVRAIKDAGPRACQPFLPQLPADDDYASWMELGALFQRQHRELASDELDFAKVAERGQTLASFREARRWTFLGAVQQRYLAILDELDLWDLQTARLVAIERRECHTDKDIALVATSDMNVTLRHMLDQVADRVTALIHAPPELADRFDDHGCLVPDAWQDVPNDLQTNQVRVVQGPAEQAEAVVATIAGYDARYRADEIVVGVLDEQLVPHLLHKLSQARLSARWLVGKTVRETGPYKLLEALVNMLERGRFADLAALVRHPDVAGRLASQGRGTDWIIQLDQHYRNCLPRGLESAARDEAFQPIAAQIERVLKPLGNAPRTLAEWAAPVAGLLAEFYGDQSFRPNQPHDYYTLQSLEHLRAALDEFQQIPQRIAPHVTAAQAIEQLLKQVGSCAIPSLRGQHQIELLGWLELPLDMAPALVATSFNEGFVPNSVNSDLFLPNALRQQLGLLDNRRRYARDAYALSVLLASRQDLTLIVGRRTVDGDPLVPSRLLFATDPRTMAERADKFFRGEKSEEPGRSAVQVARPERKSHFVVRKPAPNDDPITDVRVTALKDYIACPYRYYLRHVLNLRAIDDAAQELGPDTFGTLLHDILKMFGDESELHTETNADKIRRFLNDALNRYVASKYGSEPLAALTIQFAQARRRLDAFADLQAARANDGWKITYVETAGGETAPRLQVDPDQFVTLHGRIDRIDCRDDQWAILDYKTGDTKRTPQETHRKGKQWIDLQLPLYVHLARTLGYQGKPQLGYIVLPKDRADAGVLLAKWDDAALADATARATAIARCIYNRVFWPPARGIPKMLTEFAAICQDDALHRNLEEVVMEARS